VFLPVAFTFIIIYIVRSFKRPDLVWSKRTLC
jgi:hypothetical protein